MNSVRCRGGRIVLVAMILLGTLWNGLLRTDLLSAQTELPYDPERVASALMSYPIPPEELFWEEIYELEAPGDPAAVGAIAAVLLLGLATYEIYPDTQAAINSPWMTVGDNSSPNVAIDSIAENGDYLYNRLVAEHRISMKDRPFMKKDSDGSYLVCVSERNVVVCGFSTPEYGDWPEVGAEMNALISLALLLEVMEPPS